MMDQNLLRRYSAAEIALLVIFAAGLAVSLALVRARTKITLSEPVALAPAGLGAPLPAGEAWETAGGWRYESDNAYVLLGVMRVRGRPMMHVRWRYALCDQPQDTTEQMQAHASRAGGRWLPLGTTDGPVPMPFGRILAPTESRQNFLVGVVELDLGRRLELLISYHGNSWFAEDVFRTLAAGLVYDAPEPLERGKAFVQRFMQQREGRFAGLSAFQGSRFLIKDPTDRPLGFAEEGFFVADENNSEQASYRLTSRRLTPAGAYKESDLRLSRTDETFEWTTRSWAGRSRQPREVRLQADADGQIRLETNTGQTRTLWRSGMLLPEPLLPAFGAMLLEDGAEAMIIDVLAASGYVVPTQLAAIDLAQSHIRSPEDYRVIRASYLHRNGAFDELIFDPDGRYIGRFEQEPGQRGRLWKAAEKEQLQELFGPRYEQSSRRQLD